jgi:type I restriction enzyme S subunit
MKDSGVPWLGEVPEHWEIQRAKTLFRPVDLRSESGFEELLTVSSNNGVVPRRSANVTMFKAESYAGHKLCWPGDLVINSLWAWSRGLGVSRHHGIVSTAYGVYRTRDTNALEPRFVHELVRSAAFHWELRVRSKGVWTSRLQLTDESFLGAPFPVPPLPEQAAIVRFLDHTDRRIRRYIRAKQKLIKLLEEQKQAIIHRAVTRGLDPTVRFKPVGVVWLGAVPEHWNMRPLKHCIRQGTSISYGIVQPGEHTPGGVPFVQTGNLTGQDFEPQSLQRTTREIAAKYPRSVLSTGDVLLGIRASVGMAAVAPHSLEGANLSRGIARIVPSASIQADFLVLYLRSRTTQQFWTTFQQGTTFNEIPIGLVRTLPVLVPPVQEQHRIVTVVHEQCRVPDHAIESARNEISLLREYRTRLIADVATGKLDVREAAARLPDEVEQPEPLDEIDTEGDTDEAGTDDADEVPEKAEA